MSNSLCFFAKSKLLLKTTEGIKISENQPKFMFTRQTFVATLENSSGSQKIMVK